MLREVVDQECVGGIWCASARVSGINFQACSFNHSDISPHLESTTCERLLQIIAHAVALPNADTITFVFSGLSEQRTGLGRNCVRPRYLR